MKVFIAEFSIFNQVYWRDTHYKITASSMEELKRTVFSELEYMGENITKEEKWSKIHIYESVLEFPIIEIKNF